MAVYAIGDIQGCLTTLQTLLERLHVDPSRDRLWFTGDLVDRGPQSLEVLRFVKNLGNRAVVVLGNHDLHLLAMATGAARIKPHKKFKSILDAPDRKELMQWLGTRPLLHHDPGLGYILVHAGLPPQWDIVTALKLARETENILAEHPENFFPYMFGNLPDHWDENLPPPYRWRVAINAMTRLRYCDTEGNMALKHNEPPGMKPSHIMPWFDVPWRKSMDINIIFGHWSTLGLCRDDNFIALDSGCGFGGDLTAARLDVSPVRFYSVPGPKEGLSGGAPTYPFPVPNPENAVYNMSRVTRIVPEML